MIVKSLQLKVQHLGFWVNIAAFWALDPELQTIVYEPST